MSKASSRASLGPRCRGEGATVVRQSNLWCFFYGGGAGNHLIQATPLNWKLTAKLNKNSKVFFGDTGGISMLIFLKKEINLFFG